MPPLPPRTQFETCPETQSYENLAEAPDYVTMDDEIAVPPPYSHIMRPGGLEECNDKHSLSSDDYDDIGKNDDIESREDEEDYDDVE